MKHNYLSYLLRVWQTGSSESLAWVASLEDPHSHQVIHFKDLEAMLRYLEQSTRPANTSPTPGAEMDEAKDNQEHR